MFVPIRERAASAAPTDEASMAVKDLAAQAASEGQGAGRRQAWRSVWMIPMLHLSSARNRYRLRKHLALLVRRQKGDIRSISAAANPDNAFNRCKSRWVDQPPAIFEKHLEDRVEVGWLQLKRIGADGPGGNTQRPRKGNAQMGEVTTHTRTVYKCPLRCRLGVADARHIINVAMNPIEDCHYSRHAVAGSAEFTLCKSHELVRRTKPAG